MCCYASEDCGERRHVLQEVKVGEGSKKGRGKRAWWWNAVCFILKSLPLWDDHSDDQTRRTLWLAIRWSLDEPLTAL